MSELPKKLPAERHPLMLDRRAFLAASLGVPALVAGGGLLVLSKTQQDTAATLRALQVDHDKCCGCHLCEAVCDEQHHPVTIDGASHAGRGNPRQTLIQVVRASGPYYLAWACLGCPDVPCVRACSYYADRWRGRRALDVDPRSGAVVLDREACAGCERCIEACDRDGASVLRWDEHEFITGVCDLCGGKPRCVEICPTEAIKIVAAAGARPPAHRKID